ncbi:unnamed protein product, partial [Heterosigma akashiwo]
KIQFQTKTNRIVLAQRKTPTTLEASATASQDARPLQAARPKIGENAWNNVEMSAVPLMSNAPTRLLPKSKT